LRQKSLIGLIISVIALFLQGNSQSVSGVINTYHKVTAINTLTNTLTVSSPAGLSPGQRILIIQMKGATINVTNSASFGNMVAINNAGNYELNTICSIVGNDVVLQNVLLRTYTVSGYVQIVSVPQYTSVTVTDTLRANAFNSAAGTGGVIALRATDTIFLNSGVTATGAGFPGGALTNFTTPTYDCVWSTDVTNYFLPLAPTPNQYYSGGKKGEGVADYTLNQEYARGKQANGGGGGNNHNAGGAGGANYGAGGNGGRRAGESAFGCHGANGGIGGLSLSASGYTVGNNKIFLGGGGGAGHGNNFKEQGGGNGGGIVILIANVIVSSGRTVAANGAMAYNAACYDPYQAEGDGAGGGGAGGTIILDVNTISGTITTEAIGANGANSSHYPVSPLNDCTGPGGGGGGGVVWVSAGSFPGAITSTVTGGANGIVSMSSALSCRGATNNATAGTVGANLTGHTFPTATSFTCAPLPATNLKYFKGRINSNIATLQWELRDGTIADRYILEKSEDGSIFSPLSTISNNGNRVFSINDASLRLGPTYYRLKILNKNASTEFSTIIRLTNDQSINAETLILITDQDKGQVMVNFNSYQHSSGRLILFKATGEKIKEQPIIIRPGQNKETINTLQLPNGTYVVSLVTDTNRYSKKFLVQK